MDKTKDKFNKLLNQYKTLSHERLEVENEITKSYESLMINKITTITSDSLNEIMKLRERLDIINREIRKIDRKIMNLFQ